MSLLLYGAFLRCVALVLSAQLLYLITQIPPWCGVNGVYPFHILIQRRRNMFPSVLRYLYFPSQLLDIHPTLSRDKGLIAVAGVGALGGIAYAVYGLSWLLILPGFAMIVLYEPGTLQWPWHYLGSEIWAILMLSSFAGHTELVPWEEGWSCTTPPSFSLLFTFRILAFRLLFGFGKNKFVGARSSDVMYIRPFLVNAPLLSTFALEFYRQLPHFIFKLKYVFFFVSEIIAPLMFLSSSPLYRGIGAVSTIALMIGIQVTGCFGSFNVLTSLLMIPLFLESQGDWVTSNADVMLLSYCIISIPLIVFNSWVTSSWWGWPSSVRHHSILIRMYEILSVWRIMQSYGVFPPHTFSALRCIPVFEISSDKKTWHTLDYKYQPTQPHHNATNIPFFHPIMDFVLFYPVGYGGFCKAIFDVRAPLANLRCRPINAIARNLLTSKAILTLFHADSCRKGKEMEINYVRCRLHYLMPVETPEEYNTSKQMWKVYPGTVEIPCVSEEDLFGPYLEDPFIDSVEQMDPTLVLWRQRCAPVSSSYTTLPMNKPLAEEIIKTLRSKPNMDLNDAAALSDQISASDWRMVQTSILRRAFQLLEETEHRYINDKTTKGSHFDYYLRAMDYIVSGASPEHLEAGQSGGLALFVFLYSATVRAEASVYRRMSLAGQMEDTKDPNIDKIVPGYGTVIRRLSKELRLPGEVIPIFEFNAATLQFEFKKLDTF
eukprot:PhF_6_TR37045/c0_g1_i2/m.54211